MAERYDSALVTASACVVIGREIVVSALREWMARLGRHASVRVNQVAKVKTAMQMVAIVTLLTQTPSTGTFTLIVLGKLILIVAVILTLWSMVMYLQAFAEAIMESEED